MIHQDGTDTAQLVRADWLDDQGDSRMAQSLREDVIDSDESPGWVWERRDGGAGGCGAAVGVGVGVGGGGGGVGGVGGGGDGGVGGAVGGVGVGCVGGGV